MGRTISQTAIVGACAALLFGFGPTALRAEEAPVPKDAPQAAQKAPSNPEGGCPHAEGKSCCAACQQAKPKADAPAESGGCPCQRKAAAAQKLCRSVARTHLGIGVVSLLFVSILSTLHPVFLATRVQPVVAMSARE